MPLHPTLAAREKIMVYGVQGVGKTTAWLSIARRAQQTKADTHFYVLDTDDAVEAMLERGYTDLENVTYTVTQAWEDERDTLSKYLELVRPDDWLVVDSLTPGWMYLQNYYIEQIFGMDPESFFFEARKNNKKGTPLDGYKDWGMINKMWHGWMSRLLFKSKCHVFATAQADALSDNDSKELRQLLAQFGVKPKGQKEIPFPFHTLLLAGATKVGETHILTTVKDREREYMVAEVVKDFSLGYLIKRGSWKLA